MEARDAAFQHLTDEYLEIDAQRESMKLATIAGLVLIVLGIGGFVMGGFSFTHEKHDAQIGPVEISHQSTKTVPISPVLSAVALIGGVALVVVGTKG